jgi:uncharacterized protein YaaW (UPF0174 family)/transcriptional regulator with XRE-family HTH domain
MLTKEIRDCLGLSQEQLASIVSVTQATIARWESGAAEPGGSTAFKIRQLSVTLTNPTERQMVADILDEPGGIAALAALLTLGSSFEKAADSMGVPSLFSASGVPGSVSALAVFRVLSKIINMQKGGTRMSELPLRESDTDLMPLLRKCTNEDLDPLIQYILQKGWLNKLEMTEVYKKNQPNHTAYVDEICSEIQRFGGHTIANVLRGGEGATYKQIVCAVANRLKVNFNENREVEVIEEQILLKILEKAWGRMTDEEKAQLLETCGDKGVNIGGGFPLLLLQVIFRAGGFQSYVIMYTVASTVVRSIIGKGLRPLTNAILARGASILAGPIGVAITTIWTLFELGGPAYRVTVPCVIHIAMLRRLVALREAGQDSTSSDPSDTPT